MTVAVRGSVPARATGARGDVERFLLGDVDALPSLEALRVSSLAAFAYGRLPHHPQRGQLQHDHVHVTARHLALRGEVASLLRTWQGVGIEAIVFKGFHLAEFVYSTPGLRTYTDVDLVLAADAVAPACQAAAGVGWEVVWHVGERDAPNAARVAGYLGHEAGQLRHRGLGVAVDLHRRIVHNNHNALPAHTASERVTREAWAASERVAWSGTEVRVLAPVDAALIGVVLNRCWGSDAWQLKPRDYADLEALANRHGVTRADLVERARLLGVEQTLASYLRRCDPFRGELTLRPPRWDEVRRWNLAALPERGPRDLERLAMYTIDVAQETRDVAGVLASVRRAHARVRAKMPLAAADVPGNALGSRRWRALRRAIHRSMRLLRVAEAQRSNVAALASYDELRRRGFAVALVPQEEESPPRVRHAGADLEVRFGVAAEE